MSALEKEFPLSISVTFFFTCSGPKIYFKNPEISWKSVGRKREV
jgi:hypothetical protein